MMYRISPPETTPEYDEWLDAQDEKKGMLKKALDVLESIPCDIIHSWDELDSATIKTAEGLNRLIELRSEYARLDELFPSNGEHDPDTAYDDNVWEGDR